MLYYLFVKQQDMDNIIQVLNTIGGIECIPIHNDNGLLPEKYIQITTTMFSDLGLASEVQVRLRNTYKYTMLKSLHTTQALL
jgi:hypothetical protein